MDSLRQSTRRRVVALQLAVFLGIFGVHRWYLGKAKSGVLQALTCGGMGLWWIYDVYQLGFRPMQDGEGLALDPPVFRNLARDEQQRLVDELIDEEETLDRQRFDEELEVAMGERDARQEEPNPVEVHHRSE